MELHIVLLLVACLLVLVSVLQRVAVHVSLPASILVALVGVAIGTVAMLTQDLSGLGPIGHTAKAIVDLPISSEVIIEIFLPILLFQSALEVEVTQMIEDAGAILLLAVIAVVVATLVIGVALAPIAGVPIAACWLLGSIVATTDPVAVIGIFRDVGAPSRLTRLVEGESLLNDAAAIALFSVLLDILVGGRGSSAGGVVGTFLWEFLGGMAVGYLGARLAAALLSWLPDFRLAQVTLTIALPYVAFIVGDHAFHVSGVVAAVAAGLVMSALLPARMSPDDWKFLREMWEQLGFWGSSLIFLLASLRVPSLVADAGWHDLLLVTVLVVAALAARAMVLYGMLPGLSALRLGHRIDHRYKAVILWGGLRGAVTLGLALAVVENPKLPKEVQHFVAVMATGFVFFTLLVQGTTLRYLIPLLKLDRLSPLDQIWRSQVMAFSRARVVDTVRTAGKRFRFPDARVREVATTFEGAPTPASRAQVPAVVEFSDDDRLRLGLVALAERERELILEHFEARTVSVRIVDDLLAGVTQLLDRTRTRGPGEYLAAAQRNLGFSWRFRLALTAHRRYRIDRWLVDQLADRFEALLVSRVVLGELEPYVNEGLGALIGGHLTPRISEILTQRESMVDAAFEALVAQYPAYAEVLERRFLTMVALRREDTEYRALIDGRLIGAELFNSLRRELLAARAKAEVRPTFDLGLEARAMLAPVPIFQGLDAPQLDALAHMLRPRVAVPGERIITKGEHGDAMYFISSGSVDVLTGAKPITLARGNFFGEMALVLDTTRQADVVASSYCHLLTLQAEDFQKLLRAHPEMKTAIDREAAARKTMNEGL